MKRPILMTSRLAIALVGILVCLITVAMLSAVPALAERSTLSVDPVHSSVSFTIRHLVSRTSGRFADFSGSVIIDTDTLEFGKAEGSINVASIDTGNDDRDKHLRGEDFFDVAKFPKITFSADRLSDIDAEARTAKVHGRLTMHGITKPVVLDAQWHGTAVDPWGKRKAGFSASVILNRKDFGIVYNKALEAGGFILGDLVEVTLHVEAGY